MRFRLKRIIVISLLFAFAFVQTPLHEVFKLPVLFAHFMEHKEQDNTIDFYKYLKMHYSENHVDSDYDRDMELPFKHCSMPLFLIMTTVSNNVEVSLNNISPESKKILTGYKNPFLNTDISHNIWQPPRFC